MEFISNRRDEILDFWLERQIMKENAKNIKPFSEIWTYNCPILIISYKLGTFLEFYWTKNPPLLYKRRHGKISHNLSFKFIFDISEIRVRVCSSPSLQWKWLRMGWITWALEAIRTRGIGFKSPTRRNPSSFTSISPRYSNLFLLLLLHSSTGKSAIFVGFTSKSLNYHFLGFDSIGPRLEPSILKLILLFLGLAFSQSQFFFPSF